MIVIDVECYTNYFSIGAKKIVSGKVIHVEQYEGKPLDLKKAKAVMRDTTISFNGNNYDLVMIAAALEGRSCEELKKISDTIIKDGRQGWQACQDFSIVMPEWNHIDLFEVTPGRVSLKIYGARLGHKTLMDLPIDPSALITPVQREQMRNYCEIDLDVTERIYKEVTPQLELREKMSEQYGLDLRSKSDAQIAETVIVSELEKLTGKKVKRLNADYEAFRYQDPQIISFQSTQLQQTFQKILDTEFKLNGGGNVATPDWMKNSPIVIGQTAYTMGIGGLHSCEKGQYLESDADHNLCELDVASYYPNIILQQDLAPTALGSDFLTVYQSILDRRIKAKRSGDTVTAYTLKIAVNGSFGKLGSKYSKLYAPELLIQTTITGQLALLMLIEMLENAGIAVRSANTDGVICVVPIGKEDDLDFVKFDWMMDTSYELERTDYRCLASRDVNNYVAVKTDGSTKGKGAFASQGIAKNPDFPIVAEAVTAYIASGAPLEKTIRSCSDNLKFCMVRSVTGGAEYDGEVIGKAVRYYKSSSVTADAALHYVKNGNKVAKSGGCRPMMNVPNELVADIDYDFYIAEAAKFLRGVGC